MNFCPKENLDVANDKPLSLHPKDILEAGDKTLFLCPREILDIANIQNPPKYNDGAPIWLDFSPGDYKGATVTEKAEYVHKGLMKDLWNKFIKVVDEGGTEEEFENVTKAITYFLNN